MKKRVLITGGKGDIAQAIQHRLLEEGYDVYAPSHLEMDVTDWNSIDLAMRTFHPEILVNNAGYLKPCSIRNAGLEQTKKHIDVNLGGTYYCTAIALRYTPDLQIINIASAAAVEAHATWSEYCATKAAVVMATKCWAEDGLYAVAISPARTRTKMRKSLYPEEDPSTLLEPDDFSRVVMKAVRKEYISGTHIIVRKQNVQELLKE